jgi:hypothetical protein
MAMTDTVQEAIEVARRRYSAEEWYSMRPRRRTDAIYEVLRRLDAEASAFAKAQASLPRKRQRKRQMASV